MRRVPEALRERAVAVGGVVRDALLGLPPGDDLDLVVEGALDPPRGWSSHDRFGTTRRAFPEGVVHVGMARRERYPAPGALPEVEPGTLGDDLARRDVTVNAIALRLGGPRAGELVDPHGGLADLEGRRIRALRADAFEEDPSRVIRAARYAGRLGFLLEDATRTAAGAAAPSLDLGSARVAGELRRLLEEEDPHLALVVLDELGVPWVAALRTDAIDAALARPDAPDVPRWAARLGDVVAPEAAEAAALPGWAVATAREVRHGRAVAGGIAEGARPSEADRALRALRPAGWAGALAAGGDGVERWWTRDRHRAPDIDGSDLVAAGVAPGPGIGRALAAVRAAVLDGAIGQGRNVQLDMALRIARGEP